MQPAIQCSMAAMATVAAFTDLRARIIPNWLVIAGVVAGVGLNVALGGWHGLLSSVLGFGLAAIVSVPLFILRGTGGGDVKLMAAVGSMTGPQNWLVIFVFSSLVGGVWAICLILQSRSTRGVIWSVLHIAKELVHGRLPFRSQPNLDIGNQKSQSLPRGAVIAAAVALFLYMQ